MSETSLMDRLKQRKAAAPQAVNPPEYQPPPKQEMRAAEPVEAAVPAVPEETSEAVAEAAAEAVPEAVVTKVLRKPRAKKETVAEVVAELPAEVIRPIQTLYIDCFPVGKPARFAENVFAAARDAIRASHGVEDWRLINYTGGGVFAETVGRLLDTGEFGDIVISTKTHEAQTALSVFTARAREIVRGL